MDNEYVADFNAATGAVTYLGETYTIAEWRNFYQTDIISRLKEKTDARDITSDITNLPGEKPFFYDDWYGVIPPRIRPVGYTFQLLGP